MAGKKDKRNQDGDMPSDVASEKLKAGPDKNRQKKLNRDSSTNSTAKDPKLGNRNPLGR